MEQNGRTNVNVKLKKTLKYRKNSIKITLEVQYLNIISQKILQYGKKRMNKSFKVKEIKIKILNLHIYIYMRISFILQS